MQILPINISHDAYGIDDSGDSLLEEEIGLHNTTVESEHIINIH